VSDSDSGADSAVEQSKKRKLTKGSKSTAKKQKTSSNLIADSDEEEDTKEKVGLPSKKEIVERNF
jgi:hypothetical protein